MKNTLILLGFISLAGCGLLDGSDIPDVQLNTTRSSYAPGEEVKLVLVNFSGQSFTIHPDLCGTVLEHHQSSSWRPVSNEGVCTDIGLSLQPHMKLSSRQRLSETLPAGRYRYRYEIERSEEGRRSRFHERLILFTKGFDVQSDGA